MLENVTAWREMMKCSKWIWTNSRCIIITIITLMVMMMIKTVRMNLDEQRAKLNVFSETNERRKNGKKTQHRENRPLGLINLISELCKACVYASGFAPSITRSAFSKSSKLIWVVFHIFSLLLLLLMLLSMCCERDSHIL